MCSFHFSSPISLLLALTPMLSNPNDSPPNIGIPADDLAHAASVLQLLLGSSQGDTELRNALALCWLLWLPNLKPFLLLHYQLTLLPLTLSKMNWPHDHYVIGHSVVVENADYQNVA
ncbi:hypothetical protein BKA82DRAFT_4010445 [Pisolithus tinctorius]|nr:hypothetical protein BKA82DRAFT_4010445 [Pisolithus tinctorius]